MSAQQNNIGGSAMAKFALSVVSTASAYVLAPIAYRYASGTFNHAIVLTLVAVWMLSLTRMWAEVVSLGSQFIMERSAALRPTDMSELGSSLEDATALSL